MSHLRNVPVVFVGVFLLLVFCLPRVEGAAYGESCTGNEDCTEANNKCDTSATTNCICADNYFRKDDNTCASTCESTDSAGADQCLPANTDCLDDGAGTYKCLCTANFYDASGTCTAKITINTACDNSASAGAEQCLPANTDCLDDGAGTYKCLCTANFYDASGTCTAKITINTACDNSASAGAEQCLPANTDCLDDGAGTYKCLCTANFYDASGTCTAKIAINTACDNSASAGAEQCLPANTDCLDDGAGTYKCLCTANFYDASGTCTARKTPDAACTTGQCVANAACDTSTNTCLCNSGYTKTPTSSPTSCLQSGSGQLKLDVFLILILGFVAIVPLKKLI